MGLIWARPEPGSRQPRFSRERIAAAALEIADQEGFDAVSMRRVAAELDAGTMTLYNYVQNKDELVALMHDAILAEVLVPAADLPSDWRAALTVIAHHTRSALVRHPWSLNALQEAPPGPNAMRRFEQFLAVIAPAGLDAAASFDLLTVVNSYVFGNALITGESRKRAESTETKPEEVAAAIEFGMAQLRSGQFPHTAALFASMGTGVSVETGADSDDNSIPDAATLQASGPPTDEKGLTEQFDRGLQALLDGVALRMGLSTAESLGND